MGAEPQQPNSAVTPAGAARSLTRWLRAFLLVSLLLVVGLIAVRANLDNWVRGRAENALARAVGGSASIGQLDLNLLRLRAEFRDLQVLVEDEGRTTFRLEIAAGRVGLFWNGLLDIRQGRVWLAELSLDRPRFEIDRAFVESRRSGSPRKRPIDLRVDRLRLNRGIFRFDDQEIPLTLAADDLQLAGAWDSFATSLTGELQLLYGFQAPPLVRPLNLRINSSFEWDGHAVRLSDIEAGRPGLRASGESVVNWADGVRITAEGQLVGDLAALREFVRDDFPELGGQLDAAFTLVVSPGSIELSGPLRIEQAVCGRFGAAEVSADWNYRQGRVAFEAVKARALGGDLEGDLEILTAGEHRLTARLRGSGMRSRALFGITPVSLPLAGVVSAEVEFEGDLAALDGWKGSGSFDVEPDPIANDAWPVRGSGELRLGEGRVELRSDAIDVASGTFSLDLGVALTKGSGGQSVALSGSTVDASMTQAGVIDILGALNVAIPELLLEPLAGSGTIEAQVTTGSSTALDVRFELASGSWGGRPFDSARLSIELEGRTLTLPRMEVVHGNQRLAGSGRFSLEPLAIDALSLEAEAVAARWILEPIEGFEAPSGTLSGRIDLQRGAEGLSGRGQLRLAKGEWYGEPFESLTATFEADAGRFRIEPIQMRGPVVGFSGGATYDLEDGRLSFRIAGGRVSLGDLQHVRSAGIPLEGVIEVEGDGTLDHGVLSGSFVLGGSDLRTYDQPLGNADGTLELTASGIVARLTAANDSEWNLAARLGWSDGVPIDAVLDLQGASIKLPAVPPASLGAVVTGQVRFHGPLQRPEELRLDGAIEQGELWVGDRPLRAEGAIGLSYRDGQLAVGSMRLTGGSTDVELQLDYDVAEDRIGGRALGALDLALISLWFPEVRAQGTAELSLEAGGTLSQPDVEGRLTLDGGRIRLLGFPRTLEQVELVLRMDESHADLTELTASFGGGEVRGHGRVDFAGVNIEGYELTIEGESLKIPGPSEFEGIYDARVVVTGDLNRTRLAGEINLLRGLYDEEFNLVALTGYGSREYSSDEWALPGNVFLDLDVLAEDNVWVRNDLVEVESRIDLHIAGSLDRPEVAGRITLLEGGRVNFRDVKYEVETGSLDFVELEGLNPYLVVRARTSIEGYEVFLNVEGTLDQFEYELTSNPSLSSQDIIALLTTGKTMEEIGPDGAGSRIASDMVANYFAGTLLEKQLQRMLPVDRVQVNPLLVEGESDPTTRITLGKEVTDDLMVIFSTDVGSTERQIYEVEWQASRKFRVTGERGANGGIGGDLLYTDRFWWRSPESQGRPKRAQGDEPEVSRKETVPILGIEVSGVPENEAEALLLLLPIQLNDPFRRSEMFEGVQVLRRDFVEAGRIHASVRASSTADEDGGGVRVTYIVEPGAELAVKLVGVSTKEKERLNKALKELWTESLFNEDIYHDSVQLIREYYQSRGYYTVDVHHSLVVEPRQTLLRFDVDKGKQVPVETIEILGATEVSEDRIKRQMLTRPTSLVSRRRLDPKTLKDDLAAIRNLYRDRGYLRVRIDPPRIRLSADADAASVTLIIHEGPKFTVGILSFPPDLPFSTDELREWSGLAAGQDFSPASVVAAESSLRTQLDQRGYPEARARARVEINEATVDVAFDISPGSHQLVAAIEIRGNHLTGDNVVRREMEVAPGDVVSRERLLQSQHQLYQLGIFRRVQIRAEPTGEDGEQRLIVVEVDDSKPLSLSAGIGYDTEGGLRGTFALTDNNVGGTDRVLSFQGRASEIVKRVQLVEKEPRLFGKRFPALVRISWEEEEEVGFTVERQSAALRIDREFGPRWRSFIRYNFQRVDVTEVPSDPTIKLPEENIRLGDIGIAVIRDTRDDPFLARQGNYFSLDTSVFADALLSESSFVRSIVSASTFHRAGQAGSFASSIRVGVAIPFGGTIEIPRSERFFAGGDSTLRGFGRDEAGPLLNGVPIGGEVLFLLNQEFRVPIWKSLKGVLFYDAGNVFQTRSEFSLGDLRHVVGFGLRLETPIGPLRVEYGRKVDRQPGESSGELFLAIGPAF